MLYLTQRIYNHIIIRIRAGNERRIERDVNAYSRTCILLYFLVKLLERSRGRSKGNIRYITSKNSSGIIISIIELTILFINVVKIRNVPRVLYAPKLNLRSRP
jgi:hypothetical protein